MPSRKITKALNARVLVNSFLSEVLFMIEIHERHSNALDALRRYFETLEPYREWGDFQMGRTLERPSELDLLIEPYALYGRFRAWLRKQGINPDEVEVRAPLLNPDSDQWNETHT